MNQYINAIRHLEPIQIYGQIRSRLISKLFSSDYWKNRAETVELGNCVWNPAGEFLPPGQQQNKAETMKDGRLTFLNVEKQLGWTFDWPLNNAAKLWIYNLHYFEYLFALDYGDARQLVLDWIAKYPLKRNADGWEPYPVSLRMMNWTAYFFGRHRSRTAADHEFETILKRSLALHSIWLVYRQEYHLLGNHYFENAAALVFYGSCFNGADAVQCFQIGMNILQRELNEQILNDGMHFERSPMYHLRIVYLLKLLHDTGNRELQNVAASYWNRTVESLRILCHPDGQIALFNDAAFGIYNSPEQFFTDKNVFETESFQLPDAGYFGARTETGHYILCDAGNIGPDYIPGHAHGDLFSFELSFFGKRMIVDSGVYDYVNSSDRKYCRSTAAHNTVEIDGQDQCEFFDAFKVGYRTHPRNVLWQEISSGFRLCGEHHGYCRFSSKAVHHRTFEWNHRGTLEMTDRIDAKKKAVAVSRFHLHPDCRIIERKDNEIFIERDTIRWRLCPRGGNIRLSAFDYSPQFGIKQQGTVIEIYSSGTAFELKTFISAD